MWGSERRWEGGKEKREDRGSKELRGEGGDRKTEDEEDTTVFCISVRGACDIHRLLSSPPKAGLQFISSPLESWTAIDIESARKLDCNLPRFVATMVFSEAKPILPIYSGN